MNLQGAFLGHSQLTIAGSRLLPGRRWQARRRRRRLSQGVCPEREPCGALTPPLPWTAWRAKSQSGTRPPCWEVCACVRVYLASAVDSLRQEPLRDTSERDLKRDSLGHCLRRGLLPWELCVCVCACACVRGFCFWCVCARARLALDAGCVLGGYMRVVDMA